MTGRSELSQRTEAQSLTQDQRDASPATQLRAGTHNMVPGLTAGEPVFPSGLPPAPGTGSRSAAQEWISEFQISPVSKASKLVVARSTTTPSNSGLLEVTSAGDIGVQTPDVMFGDGTVGISQRPSGLVVAHDNQIDGPGMKFGSGPLVIPTDADTSKYGAVAVDEEQVVKPRTSTELALAFDKPHLFLAQEVEKRLPEQVHKSVNSVLEILRSDNDVFVGGDRSHVRRQEKVKIFTNVSNGVEEGYMETKPGPFEQVALTAVELLDDPEIAPQADQVVFKPLMKLARYYRRQFGLEYGLPKMPELTNALIERLDQFSEDKQARAGIYGIVQQLDLHPTDRDKIAQKMYELQDLDHPWATKLAQPFIAEAVAKRLGSDLTRDMEYMLTVVENQNRELQFSDKLLSYVLVRRIKTDSDDTTETRPGEFEQMGLAIVSILNTPDLPPHADEHVLLSLSKLMRDFRVHSGNKLTLPEMPDLTDALIKKLYAYPTESVMRNRMYGILEQVTLPVAQQEALIAKMDTSGDLDHPLAFKITHTLAQVKPESEWIQTQIDRREALFLRLEGSNQELFEHFDELLQLSRGLVFSGNPGHPRYGRVGLEIEMREGKLIDDAASHRGWYKDQIAGELGLDWHEWDFGIDGSGLLEVRKANAPESLWHNNGYLNSLLSVYRWIGDYATSVESMHLHFDRRKHPHLPVIGHMLDGHTRGRNYLTNSTVMYSRHHTTYEIRGITPPQGFGNIHPGRIEDVINMYLGATHTDTSIRTTDLLTVPVTTDKPTVKQLTWGHIVTFLPEASGRLGALMALHDEVALANVNPLAFANSYDKDSLPLVIDAIDGQFTHESDLQMIEALKLFATSDNWQEELKEFFYSEIMFDVLGIKYTPRRATFLQQFEGFEDLVTIQRLEELHDPIPVITLDMQMDRYQEDTGEDAEVVTGDQPQRNHERVDRSDERIRTYHENLHERFHYRIRNTPSDQQELSNETTLEDQRYATLSNELPQEAMINMWNLGYARNLDGEEHVLPERDEPREMRNRYLRYIGWGGQENDRNETEE